MYRSFRSFLIAALLTAASSTQAQPLNGTYTIGTAGDHTSFTAAVAALTSNGVSGPVVFNVFSGTYNEQINIGAVAGTSAINTITFQSQALDSTAVVISHPSQPTNTADWVVRLSGVDHITFRKMTFQRTGTNSYGRCFDVTTGSTDFKLLNNRFLPSNSVASREAVFIYNSTIGTSTIDRCAMVNGLGVNLQYISSGTISCTNNTMTNVLVGVTTFSISVPLTIGGNLIQTSNSGGTRGLVLQTTSGGLVVRGNTIRGAGNTFTGMLLSNVNGTALQPARFENNCIMSSGSSLAGFFTNGGTTNYLDIVHNSIAMLNGGINANALTLNVGSGTGCRLVNNIFLSSGPPVSIQPTGRVSNSDNNLFQSTDGYGVQWGSTYYYDIPSLFAGTTRNGNSIMADPSVVDPLTDLHLRAGSVCSGRGQLWAGITDDIDGEVRPQPVASLPDIGADETVHDCSPLSGTYLIGTSVGAHFSQVNGAAAKLSACGVTGPVLILIESGTYNERVVMNHIPGTSAVNSVTFRSLANDSAAVVITRPSTTNSLVDNTLVMSGADRVIWDQVTFERTGTNTFAQVVSFVSAAGSAGSQFTRFTHCRLKGATTLVAQGALVGAIINGDEDSVRFDHTRFENGTYGIQWSSTLDNDLLLVEDNVFDGQSTSGVSLAVRDRHFTVRGNRFQSTVAAAVGISIGNSTAGFNISGNQVQMLSNAMLLSGSIQATAGEPRIYNNMLYSASAGGLIVGTSSATGLRIDNNSVWCNTYALHYLSGTTTTASLRNNILASTSNLAFYRQVPTTTIVLASHNVLYRGNVGPIAFWSANQNTMAALQAASGRFANSAVLHPRYFDAPSTDLHAYLMEIDMAGTPIAHVTHDFDGHVRHLTAPDIGADEFTPQLWAETFNTCGAADPITSTGSGLDQWIYKDRKVVARFNDNGQILGTVTMSVYVNNGPVRQSLIGQHYMDRNWLLVTQHPITTAAIVRLFHSADEFNTFAAVDPVVGLYGDAGVAQYAGANENCQLMDGSVANSWVPLYPALPGLEPRIESAGGTHGFTAVVTFDGEFYITSMGSPLPVELLSFTAERKDERIVSLAWITATERENAGFEVWRMIEGEEAFKQVGWVEGSGYSQQIIRYSFNDDNGTDRTSYYRIVQVDFNGASTPSEVLPVEGAAVQTPWSLFPNPAHERFSIQGLADAVEVRLLDGAGREVQRWVGGEGLLLSDLVPGVYLVQVRLASGRSEQQRLVLH